MGLLSIHRAFILGALIACYPMLAHAIENPCSIEAQQLLKEITTPLESLHSNIQLTLSTKEQKKLYLLANRFLKTKTPTEESIRFFIEDSHTILKNQLHQSLKPLPILEGDITKKLIDEITQNGVSKLVQTTHPIATARARQKIFYFIRRRVLPALAGKTGSIKTFSIPKKWVTKAIEDGIPSIYPLITEKYVNKVIVNQIVNEVRKDINFLILLAYSNAMAQELVDDLKPLVEAKDLKDQTQTKKTHIDSLLTTAPPLVGAEKDQYGPDPAFKELMIEYGYQPGTPEFEAEKKSWYQP